MNQQQHVKPHLLEALLLMLSVIAIISYSIIQLESVPHIPILLAITLLILYGVIKKYRIKQWNKV